MRRTNKLEGKKGKARKDCLYSCLPWLWDNRRESCRTQEATLRRRAPQSRALTRGKEGGKARACGGGGSATVEFRQAALNREG